MTSLPATDMLRDSLRPFVAPAERPQGFSVDEANALADDCEIPALILDHLAKRMMALLDHGVEQRDLVAMIHQLAEVLDQCIRAFGDARAKAASSDSPGNGRSRAAAVDEVLKQVRQLQVWLRAMSQWMENRQPRPIPPLPPALKAGPGAAGYVGLDDFLTRLLPKT